jgi:protocatechuate 3,4-dioxygenase beta subunit
MKQLTRRTFFAAGAAALSCARAFPQTPACTLAAEQETGPYYLDAAVLRQSITEGKPGLPLNLRVMLVDAKRCSPIANAALDIWHCDAVGIYSGFDGGPGPGGPPPGRGPGGFGRGPGGSGRGPGGPPMGGGPGGPPPARVTNTARFLRGIQMSDKQGLVQFDTLYPGWYAGRTIHVHLKVRLGGTVAGDTYAGGHVSHTGQLFFPEDITAQVAGMEPYASRANVHRTLHSEDGIFLSQHGGDSIVSLSRLGARSNPDRFVATVTLAVDPDAVPAPAGGRGRGRGPGEG